MKLALLNGSRAGETVDLKPPGISIGRETDNDVCVLEAGMSRYHAKVEFVEGEWVVRDMGSTNGVKINDEKIDGPRPLRHGDEFRLGNQAFRVEDESAATGSNAPVIAPQPSAIQPAVEAPPPPGGGAPVFSPQPSAFQPVGDPPLSAGKPTVEAPLGEELRAVASAGTQLSMDSGDVKDGAEKPGDMFGKMDFFGGSKAAKGKDGGFRFKRPGNLLFYVCVIGVPLIFVLLFILWEKEKASRPEGPERPVPKREIPLLLVYEKNVIEPGNVFRYCLRVENGSATVELDDLKHQRHYEKTIDEVAEDVLDELKKGVAGTDFLRLRQGMPGEPENNVDETRALLVGVDGELNRIEVKNTFAPSSFEEIEVLLEDFSEKHLGVRTLQLTVEEMKAEAKNAFDKAEQLFKNREASPGNLNEAIKRYKITMELLDAFVPKPEMWDVSRRRSQEAQTMMDEIINSHEFNAEQLIRTKNYIEARAEMKAIMDMTDPDDRRYQGARKWVLKLDKQIMSQRK